MESKKLGYLADLHNSHKLLEHRQFYGRNFYVANSSNLKIGTVNGVLRQAGISAQEFSKAL